MPKAARIGTGAGGQDWRWSWQLLARCRGIEDDVFFGPADESDGQRLSRERLAKALCRSCAVLHECRDFALATQQPYGVWGGLGTGERKTLLARRR